MIDWEKLRCGLMAAAGAYLLYIAYSLFDGRFAEDSTMPMWVVYLFTVFFTLAGVALIIYGVVLWKRQKKAAAEAAESSDENS